MPNYVTNAVKFDANPHEMDNILNTIRRDGDELGSFDFNKLIPMPESLNIIEGSIKDSSVNAFISNLKDNLSQHPINPEPPFPDAKRYIETSEQVLKGFFFTDLPKPMTEADISAAAKLYEMSVPDFLALGKQYLDNQQQYGASTWYNWCIQNWGTKWNLPEGSCLTDDKSLRFDTAWSAPLPILKALSQEYPNIRIHHSWADEDIGQNVGKLTYLNGRIAEAYIPEAGSLDAYDLAFEVLEIDPEDYCLRYDVKEGTYVYDESMLEEPEPAPTSLDNVLNMAKEKARIQADTAKDSPSKDFPER